MAKSWLRELRDAYPTIPTLQFIGIFEKHRDTEGLLGILDEAEQAARVQQARDEAAMQELHQKMRVGELHHQLAFVVSADIDLEHCQAVLAYAFLNPGKVMVYAGKNVVSAEHVLDNTRNKLLGRFSLRKYEPALRYLVDAGAVCVTGSKSRCAYSVNLGGSSCKTTPHGRQIIAAANAFLQAQK